MSNTKITMTVSTIQIKEETKKKLQSMKLHPRETYEEVIERMLEDLRVSEETIADIEEARKEIESGESSHMSK